MSYIPFDKEELDAITKKRVEHIELLTMKHDRIVVVAPPKHGKTTTLNKLKELHPMLNIVHADSFREYSWTEQPDIIIDCVRNTRKWIIEGVQASRALYKGLRPEVVVVLECQMEERTKKQEQLAKNVAAWIKKGIDKLCSEEDSAFTYDNVLFIK
jgi:hypothetical protein